MSSSSIQVKDRWTVQLDSDWDVLGPFPIHAREQHYLSPAFPLNLSEPIDYEQLWSSSYADGGKVGWSKATFGQDQTLSVSFPEIRWEYLRATEGWAAFQHHAVLKTTLNIQPPATVNSKKPQFLVVSLKQGSYFALRPQKDDYSGFVPSWYPGNIYDLEDALPVSIRLPDDISTTKPTKLDLFVSGDYEIRLFGAPRSQQSHIPSLRIGLHVSLETYQEISGITLQPKRHVICDFISGYAFGNTIGVGIQSLSGWWTVKGLTLLDTKQDIQLTLHSNITIAPTQTYTVPILIEQTQPFHSKMLSFELTLESEDTVTSVVVHLPAVHISSFVDNRSDVLKGSYLSEDATPLAFLAISPAEVNESSSAPPVLALHGAGVDVLGSMRNFWIEALPAIKRSWVVIPTGRTSWGMDWHGPSARDAWASLDELQKILENLSKKAVPKAYQILSKSKVILLGHSNGGQGAWYLASRYPDRVLATIPAAAYLKSQAYIPLTLARSGHFIDPMLRAILESSLTPDDNDIHLSNLVDVDLLAIHGGQDENVPVWHTREAISGLLSWYPSKAVIFKEDPGQGHWYSDVLNNTAVRDFLSHRVDITHCQAQGPKSFTLTVANPHECGSLRGWKIERLKIPGRLGRVVIEQLDQHHFHVQTTNVHTLRRMASPLPLLVVIDGERLKVGGTSDNILFIDGDTASWKIGSEDQPAHGLPPGRSQALLTSPGLISIVISDGKPDHELSAALRLAHVLQLYHRLNSQVLTESVALQKTQSGSPTPGNMICIGSSSPFIKNATEKGGTPMRIISGGFAIGTRRFIHQGQALIATHPHPNAAGLMLILVYNGFSALERALRLFPFRTGIAGPDWIVIADGADNFGAGGVVAAGVWDNNWQLNSLMTYL